MVRKIPTQVPQAMSRLLESTMVTAPPTWYGAVLANPPPVLPPRQVTARNRPGAAQRDFPDLEAAHFAQRHAHPASHNHKQKHYKELKPRPAAIVYAADKLRRQFFADFPFEALRPSSLVESAEIAAEHPVRGAQWTRLAQRGRYPAVEDTIQFALNVREQRGCSLQDAYDEAVAQFVQLRAAHEMATQAAETEARYAGAQFKRDEWTRTFDIERQRLARSAFENADAGSALRLSAASIKHKKPKMWTRDVDPHAIPAGGFTGAEAYVKRWTLPAPARWTGAAAKPAGDLLGALKSKAAPKQQNQDELDDAQLMAAILGKQ